jgi:hypothetical protein
MHIKRTDGPNLDIQPSLIFSTFTPCLSHCAFHKGEGIATNNIIAFGVVHGPAEMQVAAEVQLVLGRSGNSLIHRHDHPTLLLNGTAMPAMSA